MRRRSAGLNIQTGKAGPSVVKQPTSPDDDRRPQSSTSSGSFDAFVEPVSGDALPTPSEGNPDTFVDDGEDWNDASMMSGFHHDFETRARSAGGAPEAKAAQTQQLGELDWAAWETPRGTTPAPNDVSNTSAANDYRLSAAYQRMGLTDQPRRASPPMIDLRQVERRLDKQKELAASGLQADDIEFFENFDADPRAAMAKSREDSYRRGLNLSDVQRQSMHEAQASLMNIQVTPNSRAKAPKTDYFGGDADLLTGSPTVLRSEAGAAQLGDDASLASPGRAKREGSWSETAGVWAGSLRRTFGSLRGHLPSARDFYVPETEGEGSRGPTRSPSPKPRKDQEREQGPGDAANVKTDEPPAPPKHHSRKLVHTDGHSQGTPFASSYDPHAISPPASRSNGSSQIAPALLHGVAGVHSSAPVSGAPGFDPNRGRNWNTGAWSLTSQEESERRKKPIPVVLKGRREETQEVVDDGLAASLTARLPKRLQLGKTWKLLYSSDQHGISLTTLYWKVASGLDANKGGSAARSAGVADAEGWLRGASTATKAALTGAGGVQSVGSGLSMSDAGLVLAVKDNEDHVFGAYVNERLRAQSGYYGNGECFLWKQADSGTLKVFPWTGKNDYMVLTEAHYLSFGGGEGKYGLWIDGALESGVSATCSAFDNDVLCDGLERSASSKDNEGRFQCITLEVWACGID